MPKGTLRRRSTGYSIDKMSLFGIILKKRDLLETKSTRLTQADDRDEFARLVYNGDILFDAGLRSLTLMSLMSSDEVVGTPSFVGSVHYA